MSDVPLQDVVIRYNPNDFQRQVHDDQARFRLVVAHRRFGKTTMAVNELVKKAVEKSGRYFYVAPYRNQAKMIAWDMFKQFVPEPLLVDVNESELTLKLSNGSKISIQGTDQDPHHLLGVGLQGVVLDEFGDMKPDVWPKVIRPMLVDTKGWAMFIGTPQGRNHFHAMFSRGQEGTEEVSSYMFKASRTGIIPHSELESVRKELPEKLFQQEFECEWLEGHGSVFRKIKQCVAGELGMPTAGWQYVMGVDLARLQDFTVLVVIDRHRHHIVHYERFNEIDWSYQKARIEAAARRFNNCRIHLDATGVGDPIEEDLRKAGLNVEGMKYTADSKRKLIENLSILIEQASITFPDIPEMIRELEAFSYVFSERTKHVSYSAPVGMHDDIVNALALACWGLGTKLPVPDIVHPFGGGSPFPSSPMSTYRPLSSKTGY